MELPLLPIEFAPEDAPPGIAWCAFPLLLQALSWKRLLRAFFAGFPTFSPMDRGTGVAYISILVQIGVAIGQFWASLLQANALSNVVAVLVPSNGVVVTEEAAIRSVVWSLVVSAVFSTLQVLGSWLGERLEVTWRARLLRKLHDIYFSGFSALRLADGAYVSKEENGWTVDQRLTSDVRSLCRWGGGVVFGRLDEPTGLVGQVSAACFGAWYLGLGVGGLGVAAGSLAVGFAMVSGVGGAAVASPVAEATAGSEDAMGRLRFRVASGVAQATALAQLGGASFLRGRSRADVSFLRSRRLSLALSLFLSMSWIGFQETAPYALAYLAVALDSSSSMSLDTVLLRVAAVAQLIAAVAAIPQTVAQLGTAAGSANRIGILWETLLKTKGK